jgi:hypothetical protein
MWTKNGSKTLRPVLNRINKIIPKESINQKIIVDDRSSDQTRGISETCGWSVVFNKGSGISDGANTALHLVETPYFCSFEQDLMLAPEWWNSMHKLILNPKVAAACGLRFVPKQNPISKLELHAYLAEIKKSPKGITSLDQSHWGRTLDNTIYNTELIREFGGFPKVDLSGVDALLAWVIKTRGYDWLVDSTVQSLHLRGGFKDSLEHQFMYSKTYNEVYRKAKQLTDVDYLELVSSKILIKRLLRSPMAGVMLSAKYKEPKLALYFPFLQLVDLTGFLRGKSQ